MTNEEKALAHSIAQGYADRFFDQQFRTREINLAVVEKALAYCYAKKLKDTPLPAPKLHIAPDPVTANEMIKELTKSGKDDHFPHAGIGPWSYYWCVYGDFCKQVYSETTEDYEIMWPVFQEPIYEMILTREHAIIIQMPIEINTARNPEGHLVPHNLKGPSLKFPPIPGLFDEQGRPLHRTYYHVMRADGTSENVDPAWIQSPETSITREKWVNTRNAEHRRIMLAILRDRELPLPIEFEELDSQVRKHKMPIHVNGGFEFVEVEQTERLLRSKDKDEVLDDYLYYAHVTCPSTKREYHIPVPPMEKIAEAVAYTAGTDAKNYAPIFAS